MPVTFRILGDQRLIYVQLQGALVESEFRTYAVDLRSDPKFVSGMNELVVLNDVEPQVSSNEIHAYKLWLDTLPRLGRVAIVAAGDFEFGMARMFQQLGKDHEEGSEIQVFRKQTEALEWLDVPAGALSRLASP
jgi:hypothetical protein